MSRGWSKAHESHGTDCEALTFKLVSFKKISYDIDSKAHRTLRPEDPEASLGDIVRPYLKPPPINMRKAWSSVLFLSSERKPSIGKR